MSSDLLTELSEADRERLEGVLVDFDVNWTPERLAATVARLPSDGPFRAAALRELVKIDLERHARLGRPVPLQHYLDQFPELAEGGASTDLRDADSLARDSLPPTAVEWTSDLPREFGRYRVIRPLGKGGMGGVYLARDGDLDRLVALKVPHVSPDDTTAVERFTREAKAAATIDHPNVCRVYDVGRIAGRPYISMAYIEGPTLADVLHDGPLPPRRAAEIARDVARALAEAHRRGVVHRDLKPANILLQRDEGGGMRDERKSGLSSSLIPPPSSLRPVVTDFGLATRTAPDDPRLTVEGVVAGTPAYMSPEQTAGERVGPASDVYSLGAVLYEMITGRAPFAGSRAEVFSQVLATRPPAPSSVGDGIDARLDAIVLKSLAKRPWDRFASMADLADALDGWLTGSRVAPSSRRPLALVVGLAVAVVLLGLVVVLTRPWGDKPSDNPAPVSGQPTTVAAAPITMTTVLPGPDRTTSLLGASSTAANKTTRTKIRPTINISPFVKPRRAYDATLREPEERIVAVAFAPDSSEVYVATVNTAGLGVRRWDATTRREVSTRVRRDKYQWATFTADGRQYLAGGGPGITDLKQSVSGKIDKQFRTEPRAVTGAVSRDGQRVIVGLSAQNEKKARVYDVDSEKPLGEYGHHGKDIVCVALSDDGKYAYSASPDRHAVWDAASGKTAFGAKDNGIRCAAFVLHTPIVAQAHQSGAITSTDLRKGVETNDFQHRHQGPIACLATSELHLMVSAGSDLTLRGWSPLMRAQLWEITDLPEVVTAIGFSKDKRWIVTASAWSWTVWEIRSK